MTLRQALELLERDGLITRRHGLGTFVASPPIDYDILHLHALAGDLSAQGEDVATRFLRSSGRVFAVERLRLVDGRPMSLQLSYLPAGIGDEVAKADLAVTPLRQVLAFKLGIDITGARESVSAVGLDGRAARELGCRRGAAAFRSDRVSLDAAGAVPPTDDDELAVMRAFAGDPAAIVRSWTAIVPPDWLTLALALTTRLSAINRASSPR